MSREGYAGNRWWSLWIGLAYAAVAFAVWYGTEDRLSGFFAGAATVYAQNMLDRSILDWKAHWKALRRARNRNRFAAAYPEIDEATRRLERDFYNWVWPPKDES